MKKYVVLFSVIIVFVTVIIACIREYRIQRQWNREGGVLKFIALRSLRNTISWFRFQADGVGKHAFDRFLSICMARVK